MLALVLTLTLAVQIPAADSPAFALLGEYDRMAAIELWPGFNPREVPLAVYDGSQTFLFRHPAPPAEFKPVAGHQGVYVFAGLFSEVRANTSVELGDIDTATMILERGAEIKPAAAVLVHEAFHVFQDRRHPDWGGDETQLFLYPLSDASLLKLRRLETEALRRALSAGDPSDSACWAAASIALRRERFTGMPDGAVAYERGTELKEGLARYVQHRAEGTTEESALPATEYAPEDIRSRCYATGLALAILLDRLDAGWKAELEEGETGGALDQILDSVLQKNRAQACKFTEAEMASADARARGDVEQLGARRASLREEFLSRPGWRLELIVEGKEPLWPQGFDPMNVTLISDSEVLHSRWVKLGNGSGTLEVLDHSSLTVAAGAHPLFNGVRRITVSGLESEPVIRLADQEVSVSADGINASFKRALFRIAGHTVVLTLTE